MEEEEERVWYECTVIMHVWYERAVIMHVGGGGGGGGKGLV